MRRTPRQRRSRQMVDALIEATARTIVERGLDQTSTNHIAARAGVSVGSLYQYFAGKDALVAALMQRIVQEVGQRVDRLLPTLMAADLKTLVRGLLDAAFELFERDEGLYLELLRNWPRLDIQPALRAFEQQMLEVFRLYVLRHYRELRIEHLPAAVFMVTNSTVFTILRYLSLPEPAFSRERLVDELTEMVAGYFNSYRSRRARRRL